MCREGDFIRTVHYRKLRDRGRKEAIMKEEIRAENEDKRADSTSQEQYTYLSVKEYAELKGISKQAVKKAIKNGKLPIIEVPHPKRADQVSYLIQIDEPVITNQFDEPILSNQNEQPVLSNQNEQPVLSNQNEQPVLSNQNEQPDRTTNATNATNATVGKVKKQYLTIKREDEDRGRRAKGIEPRERRGERKAITTRKMTIVKVQPGGEGEKMGVIDKKKETEAALKALFCDDILKMEAEGEDRRSAIRAVLELYNNGITHQNLYKKKGKLSERTVYDWLKKYEGRDHLQLAEKYHPRRGHLVPVDDLNFICGYMMSSSGRKLRSGIRLLHYWNRKQGKEMLCSDRTIERAFGAWKQSNYAIYALNRYGEKYLREQVLPMQEMDWSLVEFGELWLSDGHKLNFPVINPWTGKAERPTLVTWFEAAARMPVGFDIDFTENKRVIMSSFRNALIASGYCPKYVKLDNGKAFRSKEFSARASKIDKDKYEEEERIMETIICGALYRCGVQQVSFGIPYNSTSKAIIERWHRTLDEGIESLSPQYSGNKVGNKPARMNRNEKFLQKIEKGEALTVMEAKLLIDEWIIEVYGREPHSGLKGKTPLEAYQEGLSRIPAEQKKSAEEFFWLMLSTEVKKLDHNGVKVNNIVYWAEEMVNYVGQEVTVRYDQMDDRQVYVFRNDGEFICRAEAQRLSDPIATMRPGGELAAMELTNRIKQTRSIAKRIKRATEEQKKLLFKDDELIQQMIQNGRTLVLSKDHEELPEAVNFPKKIEKEENKAKEAIEDIYKKLGLDN